jgi:LSD1 subclass zinc finger protein
MEERIDYLENALVKEPAHPLAQDAMAIARGRVPAKGLSSRQVAAKGACTIQCPNCAGALHYEPGAQKVVCQYCGHPFDLEEINLLDSQAPRLGDLRLKRRFAGHTWAEVQRLVHCQSCGAELSMSRHLAKQCLFCGSSHVLVQDAQQDLVQPDGFLPFQIDEEQARAAIQKAQHSGLERLKTWWAGQEHQVQDLQGVYLPFWVFDGFVEIRTQVYSQFDHMVRRGSLSPLQPDSDLLMFHNLLFAAMEKPGPDLLRRILPFELTHLVPYEPKLLANWPAALYHYDVETVVEEAYESMLDRARRRAGPALVQQKPGTRPPCRTFQVTSVTYQLVLLPVWTILVQRQNRYRLTLVNGQTGKVVFGSALRPRSSQE